MQGTDWCGDLTGHTMNSTVRDMARMGYDVGINRASGAGGQRIVIHSGLDLVMVIRDDASNNGHTNVWNAVRPALVALDATFDGDEAAFTEAYAAGR